MTCERVSLATARRLKDAGWTAESDCFYEQITPDLPYVLQHRIRKKYSENAEILQTPCLCEILKELPADFTKGGNRHYLNVVFERNGKAWVCRIIDCDTELFRGDTPSEAAAECWMWLVEKKLIENKKKEVEKR